MKGATLCDRCGAEATEAGILGSQVDLCQKCLDELYHWLAYRKEQRKLQAKRQDAT